MKQLWLIALMIFSSLSIAQQYDGDAERTGFANLTRSGKLVNLLVEPGQKQVRLQVVGKEAGALKVADDAVEAYYGTGADRQRIKLVRIRSADNKVTYVFDRPNAPIQNLEINVKSGKGSEKFEIDTLK
jgi:hypothetical protein